MDKIKDNFRNKILFFPTFRKITVGEFVNQLIKKSGLSIIQVNSSYPVQFRIHIGAKCVDLSTSYFKEPPVNMSTLYNLFMSLSIIS